MFRAAYTIFFLAMTIACANAQPFEYTDSELAARFTVNGLRVSASSEIAIINDKLTRVGDRIEDATIIAIESDLVHLQVANRTFAMRVGSAVIRESHFSIAPEPLQLEIPDAIHVTLPPRLAKRELTQETLVIDEQTEMLGDPVYAESYGPIAPGESLSTIAESLATVPGEREQLMIALFDANPQAFGDSMDLLYAGAHLNLPTAATAVAQPVVVAAPGPGADPPQQVRVQPDDTLSTIAADYLRADITLNQLMLAIYAANRTSFGDNINVLYAFETLTIPDLSAESLPAPDAAQATVSRHMMRWQARSRTAQIQHNSVDSQRPLLQAAAAVN